MTQMSGLHSFKWVNEQLSKQCLHIPSVMLLMFLFTVLLGFSAELACCACAFCPLVTPVKTDLSE